MIIFFSNNEKVYKHKNNQKFKIKNNCLFSFISKAHFSLIDQKTVSGETRKVAIVFIPLEERPRDVQILLAGEAAFRLARSHAPDDERLVVNASASRVARDQVSLTRRKVNELHALMREAHELLELGTGPQSDAFLVERCQVGSFRRPLETRFCPFLIKTKKKQMKNFNQNIKFNFLISLIKK